MTLAPSPTMVTPDDLLQMEDQGLFELVDGQLVEKQISSVASETAGIVGGYLFMYLRESKTGKQFPEQTFRCFPHDPDLIRRPDIAVILGERVDQVEEEGHVRLAPDLAIEVVSPNDVIDDFYEKLEDYWSAGVKLVWQIVPNTRVVQVYRKDGSGVTLHGGDTLSGEAILPGFAAKVDDLLPAPRKKK